MRKAFINIYFYTSLLIGCSLTVSGQQQEEIKQIIQQINAHYEKTPDFRTKVNYLLYKDHTSTEIVEADSAEIVRYKGISWYKMGDIETLSDGQFDLMVHHEDKTIVISDYRGTAQSQLPHGMLDSLLAICTHFEQSVYGTVGCIYLGFDRSESTGVSICYNSADFSLHSLTTYYRHERKLSDQSDEVLIKPRLEIRYSYTDTSPKVEMSKIKHTWFVRRSGQNFQPTQLYKSYQIFNQIMK
jgi:hypothetical protein